MSNRKMSKLSSREESRIFSRSSVLSVMDRFVQAVDNMNETVMVPSRLMDISYDLDNSSNGAAADGSEVNDYYAFYSMLNAMKNELLWGGGGGSSNVEESSKGSGSHPPYQRRLSTVSSLSLSDSEADNDSLSESEISSNSLEFVDQTTARVARNFRHHLVGLYNTLNQLTDSATVLTGRYQQEVDNSS